MAASLATFQPIPVIDIIGGPFSIISDVDYTTTSLIAKIKIYKYSFLMESIKMDNQYSIDNIDTSFTVKAGDKLYLNITYDEDGSIDEVTVKQGRGEKPWEYYPEIAKIENKSKNNDTQAKIKEASLLLCSVVN